VKAHSTRKPLNYSFSNQPQVAQLKQRDQLRRVFEQDPIPCLAIDELAIDHHEGLFNLGPNACLGLSNLSIMASSVFLFFKARHLPGIMETCQSSSGCCA
jgi:hypothetical protein